MLIARIMGICFGGVGITVLVFLWAAPFGDFHSPPLFFRVFGSFVAIPFVAIGTGALFGKLPNAAVHAAALRSQLQELKDQGLVINSAGDEPPVPGKLKCPNCGSSPGTAEVSPHGDVKCDHCGRWYNVHAV